MKQNDLLMLLGVAVAAYFLLNKKPAKKTPKIIVHPLDEGEFLPDSTKLNLVQTAPPVLDYTQPYVYGRNVLPQPKETFSLNKVSGGVMLSGVSSC